MQQIGLNERLHIKHNARLKKETTTFNLDCVCIGYICVSYLHTLPENIMYIITVTKKGSVKNGNTFIFHNEKYYDYLTTFNKFYYYYH